MDKRARAICFAILAALLYAVNMPASKALLEAVPSTLMAGLLYLGAGVGVGCMFLLSLRRTPRGELLPRAELLSRGDAPYVVGMVALDIVAPVLLMYGLRYTASENASLLNNFEIVATSVIALAVFKEAISRELWLAIALVTAASIILSFEGVAGMRFSWGSLPVLAAAVCWGLENNCTRRIADKSAYEIVTVKGLCSGAGSLVTGFLLGERLPRAVYVLLVMLLGFVAYGLSIFFYIKAQKQLGAAKTSAYYAVAPFAGAFLSFVFLKEPFTARYFIALLIMLAGSVVATADTLGLRLPRAPKR